MRGPPKACRILPRRQHAADCYIKLPGSSGFRWFWLSSLPLNVVLRTSAWSCTISVKKSRLWKTPRPGTSEHYSHPSLALCGLTGLFIWHGHHYKEDQLYIHYTAIWRHAYHSSCVNRGRNISIRLLFQINSKNVNADWIRFGTISDDVET